MQEIPYMRPASVSDTDELRNMLIEDDPNDYIPDILEEWLSDGGTYVATDGHDILGMAHKQMVPDGSLWLGGLRVRRAARRSGVGRLIANFMIRLPDSDRYRLVIDEENEASINLTLSTGYTERLTASLWVSRNAGTEVEMTELGEDSVKLEENDYFGGMQELKPTAWYGLELNARALRVMDDYGLKFVSDSGRNIFLLNQEHRAVTPLVLREREMLSALPDGFVLFGSAGEDFQDVGFEQTLWARRLIFFEYRRSSGYSIR